MKKVPVIPKLTSSIIREVIEQSVLYGITRAYKHSDQSPPNEAHSERIAEATSDDAMNKLYEILDFDAMDKLVKFNLRRRK